MKYAFVQTLLEEAKKDPRIMLLTADLGFTVFEEFQKTIPKQFINVGMAEQNLMGVSAGLALTGRTVFAYSIGTFATMRPFEFIRNDIAATNAPVIVVGTGAGLCYSDAQLTHHSLEDIALMRLLPHMTVVCPADPDEVRWATKALIKLQKPAYLRLGKRGEPAVGGDFQLGKASVIKKGKRVCIVGTGNIVFNCLRAAEHTDFEVVNMHTIQPLDRMYLTNAQKRFDLIVTVEEHYDIGGLGSAVCETVSHIPVLRIGVPNRFINDVGSQEYLREQVGLSPRQIAKRIERALQ
jgi:transketolase